MDNYQTFSADFLAKNAYSDKNDLKVFFNYRLGCCNYPRGMEFILLTFRYKT